MQGQPLVRLDDADAEADLNAVGGQIGALEAETSANTSRFRPVVMRSLPIRCDRVTTANRSSLVEAMKAELGRLSAQHKFVSAQFVMRVRHQLAVIG